MNIEVVSRRKVRAIAALFDQPIEDFAEGVELPWMWHVFFLLPTPSQAQIGVDGHPSTEATPVGMRRMFAGGRITRAHGIRVGDTITSTSEVAADKIREGKRGQLRFVTHRSPLTTNEGEIGIVEERDIVYMPLTSNPTPSETDELDPNAIPAAALEAGVYREITVDTTLLFRFSALTYNAHRIHYDRDYTKHEEGYPGLVVHGPLQAVLMANLAQELWSAVSAPKNFTFRLVAPLFEGQGMFVTASEQDGKVIASVVDRTGRTTAEAVLEP